MIKCNLCVRHFHERKTFNIQHSGGSRGGTRGGPPPAPIFRPNWGPKGQKTFFLETAPPLSQGLDPVIQHHSPGPDPYKLTMWEIGRLRNICRERNRWCLKPGFHMSGKSQTIRGFTFCRPSQIWPIYRIIARFSRYWIWREMENAPKIEICTQMYDRETGVHFKILRVEKERNPSPSSPTVQIWVFICREWYRSSQKSGTRRETAKSPIVWDFPA